MKNEKDKSLAKAMSPVKFRFYWSSELEDINSKRPVMVVRWITSGDPAGYVPDEEKLGNYSFIQRELRNMLGKVLTVIDASIVDPRQNKATKDIIRNEFIDEYVHLSDMMVDQRYIKTEMDRQEDIPNTEEISLEDVAGA